MFDHFRRPRSLRHNRVPNACRIPKDERFREAPTFLTLAVGLVVFTVLRVGFLIHALISSMPLAIAFALAVVVAPTDAIAVSAIAARAPIPMRTKRILQGESLFNDASGLVCMRFAGAAALTDTFVLSSALDTFLWVAMGGLFRSGPGCLNSKPRLLSGGWAG